MTQKTQPPSITHLKQQAKIFTFASVILLSLTAVMVIFSITLTNQQTKKITTTRQELASLKDAALSVQSLQTFAQSKQEDLTKISNLFPNEDDFVYVLQDIETLVKNTDPQGSVKVSAAKPTKAQNLNTIPLTIHLVANPNSAVTFLREFERLPYILQITNLELTNSQDLLTGFNMILTVRLYVADPFST